jgi:hypothetical protein
MEITPARDDIPPSREDVTADLRVRAGQLLQAAEALAADRDALGEQPVQAEALGRVVTHLTWCIEQMAAVVDGLEAAGWPVARTWQEKHPRGRS